MALNSRRIIGISLAPEMATEVKMEASRRNVSMRKLFEEMWTDYRKKQPKKD